MPPPFPPPSIDVESANEAVPSDGYVPRVIRTLSADMPVAVEHSSGYPDAPISPYKGKGPISEVPQTWEEALEILAAANASRPETPKAALDAPTRCFTRDRADSGVSLQRASSDKLQALVETEAEHHETKFSLMKSQFCAVAIRDSTGKQVDVDMGDFFEACQTYRDILSKMGKAVSVVLADIEQNLGHAKVEFLKSPLERKTMKSYLTPLGPDGHPGIPKMMWLLRGAELFLAMLKILFTEEGGNAAVKAYEQTLMQYHGWALQMTVRVAMRAMPGRDTICQSEGLVYGSQSLERCRKFCIRDAPEAAEKALEQIHFCMELMKQSGHWDTNKA